MGHCDARNIYRYKNKTNLDEGFGSNLSGVDFLIYCLKLILLKLRIKKYSKTGYTLVLKEN